MTEDAPRFRTLSGPAAPIRRQKVTDLVVGELRRLILHEARVGDALPPERVLIEKFGVSRPTLREALRVLESDGLVEIRRGIRGGAIVRQPGIEDMARMVGIHLQLQQASVGDLYLVRKIIEPAAARLAAGNEGAGAALDEALAVEAAAIDVAGDEDVSHVLVGFHEAILDLSGSTTLATLGRLLDAVVQKDTLQTIATVSGPGPAARKKAFRKSHQTHQELAVAIKAGDADGAEGFMRRHLEVLEKAFWRGAPGDEPIDLFRPPDSRRLHHALLY